MSKNYERLPESSEAFVYVAMIGSMARRLELAHGAFQTVSKVSSPNFAPRRPLPAGERLASED